MSSSEEEYAQLHVLHRILAKRDGKPVPGVVVPGAILIRKFAGRVLPSGAKIHPSKAYEVLEGPAAYRAYHGVTVDGSHAWLTFREYRRRIKDRARDADVTVPDNVLKDAVRGIHAAVGAVCVALVSVLATPAAGAVVAAGVAGVDLILKEHYNPRKVGV